MGAKKPSTPTKQNNSGNANTSNGNGTATANNNLSSVVKSLQIKKVTAKDAKSSGGGGSLIAPKDKDGGNDAKKQTTVAAASAVATSNKKSPKLVANNVKVVKKSQNTAEPKKSKSQEGGGKGNKSSNNKVNGENKSIHIAVSVEEDKSDFNLTRDESNKAEKSSSAASPLSLQCESAKRKLNEKEGESKSKPTAASSGVAGKKTTNNKSDEKKTIADKQKAPSKVVRKVMSKVTSKEQRESKVKISNELKNLGIEMSKSNSSFDSIQEDLSSGVKTSICEMVKLKKARHPQNASNACKTKSASQSSVDNGGADNKSLSKINKESPQGEKVKKTEPKSKAPESATSSVQSEDEKSQKVTKKVMNNTQNTTGGGGGDATSVKRKYAKKNKEVSAEQPQGDAAIASTSSEAENKPKEKKAVKREKLSKSSESVKVSTPKKLKSDVQSSGKVNTPTISASSVEKRKNTKKQQQQQTEDSINNTPKEESSEVSTELPPVVNIKKESVDAKQRDTVSSNKSKERPTVAVKNNEAKKVPPKKVANEIVTKSANNGKSGGGGGAKDAKKGATIKKDKSAPSKKHNNNSTTTAAANVLVVEERDPLKLSSSESGGASDNSDSDMEISDDIFKKPAKPQAVRNATLCQVRVIKKSRVASLNAIAKVHCLYENEARTHLDSSASKAIKKPVNVVVCNVSSDDDDDADNDDNDEEEESDNKEVEIVSKRSLRTAPGLRAVGKHWEMDSMSSEIDSDSDASQRPVKFGSKAKSIARSRNHDAKQQHDSKAGSKLKNQIKKSLKQSTKQTKATDDTVRDSDKEAEKKLSAAAARKKQKISAAQRKPAWSGGKKKPNGSIKRKKTKDDDRGSDKNVVTKKRMASLNASAILAANYEIENYAAKHESSTTETSDNSEDDEEEEDVKKKIEPPTMKKEKKDVKMESAEEARPKSTTNLVKIDTDVTITGVYVNSALVSSQETICKTLKYRTAYSVTEECVVSRPPTQEPPKSYTPLSALTNMRPPMGQQLQDPCMTSSSEQYQPQMPHQPQPQMYDQHMGPMPPSYQYPPSHPPHPMPSTSSAFYSPQQVHRDPMGYYQPAGPLISPHLLPPPPPSLEGDQSQSTQPTSGAPGENDPDVMITGGDIAPRPQPYRYGPHPPPPDFSRPLHPQQMHYPPTYPPYYYGQPPPPPPPTDLCYPYYPPKYYPNSPYARRPYMAPGYYQPPPLDYRSQPQPVPQNAPQQIVPAAPTPQHIDPHFSSSPYYPSAYSAGGQCYSQTPPRNLQPAYLDAHQYHSASCPCPMQSCQSKNVHTGTGPTNKAKGPVSGSSGMAESSSSASAATVMACKIENNILSPSVLIKPETDKMNGASSMESQVGGGASKPAHHELYSMSVPSNGKMMLDVPELSPSPARGSTGIQQTPTVQQYEAAVQPTENNLNSDNVSLSLRKQARIGKSMERDRQQQNHTGHGYLHNHHHLHHHGNHAAMMECNARALETSQPPQQQFKQEFPPAVKRERESDVKLEKDCDMDIEMDFRSNTTNTTPTTTATPQQQQQQSKSIKVERQESEAAPPPPPPPSTTSVPNQKSPENDAITVSLISESGDDECGIDYSIKRKHDDSDADVIELSDNNSTLEAPTSALPVKRRKLLATPVNAPKKSPPNSYKNLIKPNAAVVAASPPPPAPQVRAVTPVVSTPVTRPKLLPASRKIKRKNLLKSKSASSAFKTIGFAIKAKRRALLKRKKQLRKKKAMEANEEEEQQPSPIDEEGEQSENGSSKSTEDDSFSLETCERASTETSEEKSMDGSSECSGKSNIDLTIDRVAKGYFSESDVFSSLSKHRKTKGQKRFEAKLLDLCARKKKQQQQQQQHQKNRNVPSPVEKEKSQSKKKKKKLPKVNKERETQTGLISTAAADPEMPRGKKEKEKTSSASKKAKKTKAKEPKEKVELIKEKKKSVKTAATAAAAATKRKCSKETEPDCTEREAAALQADNDTPSSHSTPKRKHKKSTATAATLSDKNKSTATEPSAAIESDDDKSIEPKDEEDTTTTSLLSTTTATTTTVKTNLAHLDETDVANNNNECFENNNHRQKQQEPLTLYKTVAYGWTTALSKGSGKRGRKGRKLKLTLPNDIVIPKSTSIPRWSNGWVFEGEPYQALVFLNSDDPPVPRTCYDSMRHEECGDVIRPRDCVLLRAGGKRNELPYVAKVAQLFENPEDGEMMMSLFWYYRPEHTEQGRQSNDAVDEVFASRHKDHNSVACIEDKCYVITYNEYCRYRKSLKAAEENVEEPPSVVPRLQSSSERRLVPPSTSPELVMFCRRVYDFRAKRLMDDKKKK